MGKKKARSARNAAKPKGAKRGAPKVKKKEKAKSGKGGSKGGQRPAPNDPTRYGHIKNKGMRQQLVGSAFYQRKRERTKLRRERQAAEKRGEAVEKQVPHTVENMREEDETLLPPDDEEVLGEDDMDEFMAYFKDKQTPKIFVTTKVQPSAEVFTFLKEITAVIPNMSYYPRKKHKMKEMVATAIEKKFTDFIVVGEKAKKPNGLYISHLPEGPTSFWRLTRLKLGSDIKGGATCNAGDMPELILNNFDTRLGRRVGRQLAALFPQQPDFRGRRTIALHNQRDFVFFRHYRYIFRDATKCRLQEIGPRFTLKLRYLQHGTFDAQTGEYEFIWRPDSQVSRKKFAM